MTDTARPALLLGPMLRYVDEVSASIWVETRQASNVVVRSADRAWSARTFAVHGHHYALVAVDALEPGSVTPYEVEIDGERVWPEERSSFPASVIATLAPGENLRMTFGSCRTSVPHDVRGNRTHGVDALRSYAVRLAGAESDRAQARPHLMLFLGDQVYADSTSPAMQQFIRSRRDIRQPPGKELADFDEYAHLYRLAWSDPANRWLMSTVPSAMIFDDHDVRDDWNASLSWRQQMERTSWWRGRIIAGLGSYWVYQHLGNLSPQERATDKIWRLVADHAADEELDLTAVLDEFAERCDREPTHYRWSFCRDFTDVRLIVIDSRAARVLDPDRRSLLGDEVDWLDERMRGGFRHVLVGTSLPFLLPTGLHHMEAWNEALSEGAWGKRAAVIGEKLRQGLDLEHWGAFQKSFRKLAAMATELADGARGAAPETVTFLSGDVHYSYVTEVERSSGSRIIQAVCSPIRNPLPLLMRSFAAIMSYGIAARLSGRLSRAAGVPAPPFRWKNLTGPHVDNALATLQEAADGLQLRWESGVVDGGDQQHPRMTEFASLTVAPRVTDDGGTS